MSLGCAMALGGEVWAQSVEAVDRGASARPVVGLVLSGGAAKGGAHIGVLQALEELRVPVDLIVGTSVGAVVGGFYATGMNADEVEQFVAEIDWDAAFRNETPRRLRSFRRKRDDGLFLVEQKPGLNDGAFELPAGVVQGQVIDMVLSRAAVPVAGIEDFDDLAVRFRAVAADLATGEPAVIGSGDLAQALRATLSVPAAISPIEIDGRLLVDGGIAMNLPVEVARSMGADVIIAVDITAELKSREELRSVVDVTSQLTNLLTRGGIEEQKALLGEADILLEPEFSDDFNSANFSRIGETVPTGFELVMRRRTEFEWLALDPAAYAAYWRARPDPRFTEYPRVAFLRLNNESRIADSVIEKRLDDIEIGGRFDFETAERGLNRVYGLEYYQNVRYSLVEERGTAGLEIDLDERSWGPNYLQFGLEFGSASREDSVFDVSASYLRTAINRLGGEMRATLKAGDRPGVEFDFYQPLGGNAMYFVAPSVGGRARVVNVFDGDDVVTEVYVRDAFLELAAGREIASWGEMRVGLRGGAGDTSLWVGNSAFLPPPEFRIGEAFGRFSIDTLDDVAFPSSGLLASLEWLGSRDSLSADADFDQASLRLTHVKSWGRHTILSMLRYRTTFAGAVPINQQFRLGGFMDLSGLHPGQLNGQHAAHLGVGYYRRIGESALFPAYAGFSLEMGNVWDNRRDIGAGTAIRGGSLWAGIDTPIGPIYVAYGFAEGDRNSLYVVLGRAF